MEYVYTDPFIPETRRDTFVLSNVCSANKGTTFSKIKKIFKIQFPFHLKKNVSHLELYLSIHIYFIIIFVQCLRYKNDNLL